MSQKVVIEKSGHPYRHVVKARGHELVIDAPKALKGGDLGMTPHEIFLAGLGACAAITMEMKAAKEGWKLTGVTVTMTEDKIADPDTAGKRIPRVLETIELEGDLTADQIDALKKYAHQYCPVYQLFVGKKQIDTVVVHTPPAAVASRSAEPAENSADVAGDTAVVAPAANAQSPAAKDSCADAQSKPADPTCGA